MGLDFMCLDGRTAVGAAVAAIRDTDLAPEALQTIFTHDGSGRLSAQSGWPACCATRTTCLLSDVASSAPPASEHGRRGRRHRGDHVDYNLTIIPVVDHEDRVLGVVTVDDLLETLIPDE